MAVLPDGTPYCYVSFPAGVGGATSPIAFFDGIPAGTPVSRSGSIAVGNTAVTAAAANAMRSRLFLQNISTADLWVNELGTALASGTNSFLVPANGGTYECMTRNAVSVVGATAGQKWSAIEV